MINPKTNAIELTFNAHRFFDRDPEGDKGHKVNFISACPNLNKEEIENWAKKDLLYAGGYISKSVTVDEDDYDVTIARSEPSARPIFNRFFKENLKYLKMGFPLGMIDFDLLNGFKNSRFVSGNILISVELNPDNVDNGDTTDYCFLLEGSFVTLPPAKVLSYYPEYRFTTNAELSTIIAEIDNTMKQAGEFESE